LKKILFSAAIILTALILSSLHAPKISAADMYSESPLDASHQFSGTISSFSDINITVNGAENSETFNIDDKTRINGKIEVGKKVEVTYAYLKIFKAYLIKKALVITVIEEKKKQ